MTTIVDTAWPCTDLGNAERLVHHHGSALRHFPAAGEWLEWDGMRWATDETGEAERCAKRTARSILEEAAMEEEDRRRSELMKHARRSESAQAIRNMLTLGSTEPGMPVKAEDLDADGWLVNTKGGTIDLRTGSQREHRQGDMITKLAPASLGESECPCWLAFLDRVFAGDAELVAYVQRCVGYSLTGDVREQVIFVLHGGGSNGKSTLIELLRDLLGDYAMQASADTFLARRHYGGGATPELARLRGARFVSAVETGEGRRLDEALVKSMTGGDTITARHLHKEYIEYPPQFKVWLATNHLPEIRGTDHAIWRRIRLIPFDVTIPDSEKDDSLPEKLRGELAGILRWALDGCLEWQRVGLRAPGRAQRAAEEYRLEQDAIGRFLAEQCAVDPDVAVGAAPLYDAYKQWAERVGEVALTDTMFGRQLTSRGITAEKGSKGVRFRRGVRLNREES